MTNETFLLVVEGIGFLGVVFGVGGNIPQLVKTMREKDVTSLSMWFLICWILGCLFNLIYVVLVASKWPLIMTNVLSMMFPIVLLYLYFKYKEPK